MKRTRDEMEIVWQTPANPPERHDYIFQDGIRYVRPYYFEFISHVKNRWARKTIVDLFTEEFKGRSRDYYVAAVKAGRLQVDGQIVPISYVVKPSQKISHFLHRHEPPVMARHIKILHKEPEVLTICKPASVPVHPCGQYRKNTVVGILQAEHGLAPLFPIHRLDRLVSGLLILARTASRADLFRQQIESGLVQKEYIARVIGVFPENEQVVDATVNYDARAGRSSVELYMMANKRSHPSAESFKMQVGGDCRNSDNLPKGKPACTKFTRISTNGTHSLVLCKPITGRTHQIRVHLQYTGHPIANDMLYLSETNDKHSAEVVKADSVTVELDLLADQNLLDKADVSSEQDFSIDPMCTNCPNLAPKGYDGYEEGLWLHCLKYSGPDWVYECPAPNWAFLD